MQRICKFDDLRNRKCVNPYKKARINAGLSRVDAAERLALSERTLAYYEAGERTTPDDVVLVMSREYSSPMLRIEHLKQNKVFADIMGEGFDVSDIAVRVLRVQHSLKNLSVLMPRIIDAAIQGEIDTELSEECRDVVENLFPFTGLCFAEIKNPRCVNTEGLRR